VRDLSSTFVWTFTYALLSVVLTFFAGLFIAIALNYDGLRFQRLQRSI
jgi:ABC-type sugar transport system permease subunit